MAAVTALVMVDLRAIDDWSEGVLLAITAAAFVGIYALGARGGRPAEPEPARSALLLASLVTLVLVLAHLTEVLGEDEAFAGDSIVWSAAAFLVIAAATGVVFRSGACVLVAAVAAGALTIAFVAVVIEPDDEVSYQWALGAYFGAFCAAGYVLRAFGERRHSDQLVNAAAIALILYLLGSGFFFFSFEGNYEDGPGRGLEALLLIGPLLAIGYGLFFRARGPAWAGGLALAAGVLTGAGEEPTLLVWPLVLLGIAAALMLAAALRTRATHR